MQAWHIYMDQTDCKICKVPDKRYCKLPIISHGLIFVQKAFLLGLFSGELNSKEFCVSKWVGLVNKNSVKHQDNSLKQLKELALVVRGLIFGRAYCRKDFCI